MTSADLKIFAWQSRSALLPNTPSPRLRDIAMYSMHELFLRLSTLIVAGTFLAGMLAGLLHVFAPNVSIWWSVAPVAALSALSILFIPAVAKEKCTEALKDWSLRSRSENLSKLVPAVAADLLAAVREGQPAEIPLERIESLRRNANSLEVFAQKCSDDPRSPWKHRPELRNYLDELALATTSLDQLIDAAQACRRHAENPNHGHVDAIRKLAASCDVDTLFRDYLLRLAANAATRLKNEEDRKESERKQREQEEQQRLEAQRKDAARRKLLALVEWYVTRRDFLISRDRQAIRANAFVRRLMNQADAFANLRKSVQRLPAPANRGQLEFVAKWSQDNATLLAHAQEMLRNIDDADNGTELDAATSARDTLITPAYRSHLRSLLLLDGLTIPCDNVHIRDFSAGRPVAILALLKHFSKVAADDCWLHKLWPVVDESGDVHFHYFGPDGPGGFAWQSFSCLVQVFSNGHNVELNVTFRIPFGFEKEDDKCFHEYIVDNVPRGNISERFFKIAQSQKTLGRNQRRFDWFAEKKTTDIKEQKELTRDYRDEHTDESKTSGIDQSKPILSSPHAREEMNRIRKDAMTQASKQGVAEEFLAELKHIEEETTGTRNLDAKETISESDYTVSMEFITLSMKAPDLYARWNEHSENDEPKQAYDRLFSFLKDATGPLEQANREAQARRRNGQSVFKETDAAFFDEVRKLAVLRSDFDGCPFVEWHPVPYDGRPTPPEPVLDLSQGMAQPPQLPATQRDVKRLPAS